MKDTNQIFRFEEPKMWTLGPVLPVNVISYNDNNTFNGTLDFDKMSSVKRILANELFR